MTSWRHSLIHQSWNVAARLHDRGHNWIDGGMFNYISVRSISLCTFIPTQPIAWIPIHSWWGNCLLFVVRQGENKNNSKQQQQQWLSVVQQNGVLWAVLIKNVMGGKTRWNCTKVAYLTFYGIWDFDSVKANQDSTCSRSRWSNGVWREIKIGASNFFATKSHYSARTMHHIRGATRHPQMLSKQRRE